MDIDQHSGAGGPQLCSIVSHVSQITRTVRYKNTFLIKCKDFNNIINVGPYLRGEFESIFSLSFSPCIDIHYFLKYMVYKSNLASAGVIEICIFFTFD